MLLVFAVGWVGPQKLWVSISNLGPFAMAAIFVLSTLNIASTNLRFCILLERLGGRTPFKDAYKANSIGQIAALFFIPLLAQIAARQSVVNKSGLPQVSNAIIGMIERLSTAALSLITALLSLWHLFGISESKNILAGVSLCEIGLTISISTAAYLMAATAHSEKQLWKLLPNLKTLESSAPVIGLTVASYSFMISCFWVAIKLTNPQINGVDIFSASAIISFAASIPISVGGWGLREVAAIFVLKQFNIDEAPALAISVSVGALSTLATLVHTGICFLIKPKSSIMPLATPFVRRRNRSLTRISAYVFGAITAALVLFQIKVSFGSTDLSVNLADPFAVLSFASVCMPILTHRELPKWGSPMFNHSLSLFAVALLVAFTVGYFKIGVTAWALGGRLTGYMVVLGYLSSGYLIAHHLGPLGFSIVIRILGITASCIVLTQVLLKSLNVDLFQHSAQLAFEGFVGNRNAFAFQLIVIVCLLLTQFNTNYKLTKPTLMVPLMVGLCVAGVLLSGSRTGIAVIAVIFGTSLALRISPLDKLITSIGISLVAITPFYFGAQLCRWLFTVLHWLHFVFHTVLQWLQRAYRCLYTWIHPDGGHQLPDQVPQWATPQWATPQWATPQWATPQWAPQWSSQSSDHMRFKANIMALQNWLHDPVFGTGLGTFIADSERLLGLKIVVHNTPIWILTEFGIFGFSLFLFMAWTLARHLLRVKAWHGTPQQKALMLTLIAFMLFCQLHEILYQRIFWLAIGISLAAANVKLRSKQAMP